MKHSFPNVSENDHYHFTVYAINGKKTKENHLTQNSNNLG